MRHAPEPVRAPQTLSLPDATATERLGARLAACLRPGLVLYLEGDLGAGKTTLTRALLRKLGHMGPVKSPSYSLVEVYAVSRLYLYHFDFYRFLSPEEFDDAGLGEYFRNDSICVVEWPEKAHGYVPAADLRLFLAHDGAGRNCIPEAQSVEGRQCLNRLLSRWEDC
ncbi:MAG: tRNA (adenosine(37)-N6)-threonylcarbamoyltransferase complex ATPase subunit type 1 TsaE [Zoogloeaceae bacterium]|jgi:tRNA threonylcarbamoyladenosine biosynthesis protein TsaE|nr:tRNA (adenosine(37)-N6)-threonylcarbamoyltransferase complex ATPase subunit type 1 TsaE [Zoogloeaceae bacterium]